jgi:hypothetical protein
MSWTTCALRHAAIATALIVLNGCLTTAPSDVPEPGSGVVDLKLPDGGVQRVLYVEPERPKAVVVPLLGGDGEFFIDGAGHTTPPYFIATRREVWGAQGIAVAALHTPQPLYGKRKSEQYARTLAAVAAYIHTRTDAPIWLVGHSNGTAAAVNGAAYMTHGEIAGIVLMAPVTRIYGSGAEIMSPAGLGRVTVPTLIVSHVGDSCIATPPSDAPEIRAALTKAPKAEVIMVEGGSVPTKIDQCFGGGQHSFAGMQNEVIERIATWMKAQEPED